MTDRIAAVGIARIAPRRPQSSPPISSATITVTGLTPTRRSIILGTRIFASSWCSTRKKRPASRASRVETLRAMATAATPAMMGPMMGIISPTAAIRAMT